MKKKKNQKTGVISQKIMNRYLTLRRITFDGFLLVVLTSFLIFQNTNLTDKMLSIFLTPVSVVAISAAKMYTNFPAQTKKSLKLHYITINPIDQHPYLAVVYVLFFQILFSFSAWFR